MDEPTMQNKVNGALAVQADDDRLALTPMQQKFLRERVQVMQSVNAQIKGAIDLILAERGLPLDAPYGLSDDQTRLVPQQPQQALPVM
jgi:hypothetical protein